MNSQSLNLVDLCRTLNNDLSYIQINNNTVTLCISENRVPEIRKLLQSTDYSGDLTVQVQPVSETKKFKSFDKYLALFRGFTPVNTPVCAFNANFGHLRMWFQSQADFDKYVQRVHELGMKLDEKSGILSLDDTVIRIDRWTVGEPNDYH